jgi:hypothetical protein
MRTDGVTAHLAEMLPPLSVRVVFEAIRELMTEPAPKSRRIGFKT